jgi:hypothetical protein
MQNILNTSYIYYIILYIILINDNSYRDPREVVIVGVMGDFDIADQGMVEQQRNVACGLLNSLGER